MLLPNNMNPENSIYYNGAIILEALQKQRKQDLLDLFKNVKRQHSMSFGLFILSLDWLYLIDVAVLNKYGEIELCS
ncbi:MAG: hypothetical protein HC880_07735 [Bacteroidia bacterium]|nr:hypothetical protein [Bacteroidia bacterium]